MVNPKHNALKVDSFSKPGVPLFPSVEWMSATLKELAQGMGLPEAAAATNLDIESPRDFARYSVRDSRDREVAMSIPVEGGGRLLRNWKFWPDLKLSDHGEWRRTHLAGLETYLGKKPFFRDLEAGIRRVYEDVEITNLADFNMAIFQVLLSFILGNMTMEEVEKYSSEKNWLERGKEIASSFKSNECSLQLIAENGRESILGFLAYNL